MMKRIASADRLAYLDWLRIFAVLMLVPFHTGMMFNKYGFHLKSPVQSDVLTVLSDFINIWHMPLFFFLSGAGAWFAMGFRSSGVFAKERVLRLLVPFVFGVLVLIPPQMYIQRISTGQFHGSFIDFYPHFFNGPYPEGNLSWNHLWFLLYLFLMSLMLLPVFAWLRGGGANFRKRAADAFSGRFSVYLPFLPFSIIQLAVMNTWPNGDQSLIGDLDNFFQHALVFFYGFLFISSEKFRDTVYRNRVLSLAGAVVVMAFSAVMFYALGEKYFESHRAVGAALLFLNGLDNWIWVLAFLGWGKRLMDFTSPLLKYAIEWALPFYLVHQTIIIVSGWYVMKLPVGIYAQYAIIIALTFVIGTAIYDLIVKRIGPIRFLFGMRAKSAARKA